eukprot:TRINITY_DN8610_c0_g1_i2.p1 TRINITY_DN8610_c0_g1~~TRINITY_DN8610_c0_g1_i2.p1  ORF type:complete len:520 (+),score=104.42 TRINITY_DN8610_c0_g1_i2:132-1691(+)
MMDAKKVKRIEAKSFYRKAQWREESRFEARINQAWQVRLAELRTVSSSWLQRKRSVWREFPRQQQAFFFASTCNVPVYVFSSEIDGSTTGSRRYLVAELSTFWMRYYRMTNRHYYELIPEHRPCHLYYDLEYPKAMNPARDGNAMTAALVDATLHHLRVKYNLSVDKQDVLILDSTTERKFSQHVIVRVPGCMFADNIHIGLFVQELLLKTGVAWEKLEVHEATKAVLDDEQPRETGTTDLDVYEQLASKLLIYNKDGESVPFVDTGVYTKNRNFRLYLSSKRGKRNPLLLAKTSSYVLQDADKSTLDMDPDQLDEAQHRKIFESSMLTFLDNTDGSCRLLRCEPSASATTGGTAPWVTAVRACIPAPTSSITAGPHSTGTSQATPYPKVEAHILQHLPGTLERPARVRRWAWFESSKTLTLDLDGYRHCERINRHHKSNGVYIVASLLDGLWYQKCHDPDCRAANFRGQDRLLPVSVIPFTDSTEDESIGADDDEDDDDDAFLAQAMDTFEATQPHLT